MASWKDRPSTWTWKSIALPARLRPGHGPTARLTLLLLRRRFPGVPHRRFSLQRQPILRVGIRDAPKMFQDRRLHPEAAETEAAVRVVAQIDLRFLLRPQHQRL